MCNQYRRSIGLWYILRIENFVDSSAVTATELTSHMYTVTEQRL